MKYAALETAGTIALTPVFIVLGVAAYAAIQSTRLYLMAKDKLYSRDKPQIPGRFPRGRKSLDAEQL